MALAAPTFAHAAMSATDIYLERTLLTVLGERCGLFTPGVSAALAAGAAQARGAALRAGTETRTLRAIEYEARNRAARIACASAPVAEAAQRVQSAFEGYSRVTRMTYRGDVSGWRADRGQSRTARWRLAQDAVFGSNRMIFGLAGRDATSALVAVADFADNQTPYAARLVMRDATRTVGPYLLGGATAALSQKLPPASATRGFLAEARSGAEAELLPKGAADGWAFRFPAAAAQALAELDPREAVAIEFMFPGERVRRAYVEVGDFAAGTAFLTLAAR
jgi:hypothetical protein